MSVRIVVLDSEPVVAGVMENILKTAGYAVEVVGTVQAATEIIRAAPPDLVITNVYLPGVTGHEAMRILKSMRPNLPVLMVSGLPDADIIREWAGREIG